MNPGNIAALAAGAGFAGNDVDIATAVAMAETGGNPQAYNPEGSYGLWQIYLPDHPEFTGWNLYDPQTNARAAFQVYLKAGGRFTPWTTYRPGKHGEPPAYLAFLPTGPPPSVSAANAGAGYTYSPPLTIDAATGLPLEASALGPGAGYTYSPPETTGPSFGQILLWAGIGFFALWLFEEAM